MGNTIGKERQENDEELIQHLVQLVDGGFLDPQGVYSSAPAYKTNIVRKLMLERRLMPFYKGLDSYSKDWPAEKVVEVVEKALGPHKSALLHCAIRQSRSLSVGNTRSLKRDSRGSSDHLLTRNRSNSTPGSISADYRTTAITTIYANAMECPICFLYYPSNFNYTRCCAQPICSECFVEIRRAEPHLPTVHANEPTPNEFDLISEPAKCPYCMTERFGVIYKPNPKLTPFSFNNNPDTLPSNIAPMGTLSKSSLPLHHIPWPPNQHIKFAHDDKNVVSTDFIHPDWQYKLERARRRALRRAANATLLNSHLLETGPANANANHNTDLSHDPTSHGGPRRTLSSRRQHYLANVEQLMLAEAIRQSLLDAQSNDSTNSLPSTEVSQPDSTNISNEQEIVQPQPTHTTNVALVEEINRPDSVESAITASSSIDTGNENETQEVNSDSLPQFVHQTMTQTNFQESSPSVAADETRVHNVDEYIEQQDLDELIHSPIASTNPFLADQFARSETVDLNAHICSPALSVSDDGVTATNKTQSSFPSVYEHQLKSNELERGH